MTKCLGSIRVRLLMPLVVAILVLCALAIYHAYLARGLEAHQTQMTVLRLAKHIALAQSQHIDDTRQLLSLLAQFKGEELLAGGSSCNTELAKVRGTHSHLANLGVIGRDGRVLCSALPYNPSLRLHEREYFRAALATGGFALGDYQTGLITGRDTINAGYPLLDGAGQQAGVLFAALDLSRLSQSLSKIPLPEATIATLVSAQGTILARFPDDGLIGTPFGHGYALSPLPEAEESVGNFTNAEGEARLYAAALLPDWNGSPVRVLVSISSQSAYGKTDALFLRQFYGLLLISVSAVALAWWWSKRLVLRPVKALISASRHIRDGNFKTRVALALPVKELNQLAKSFDAMADSLEERYQRITQQDAELLRVNRALQTLSAGNHTLLKAGNEQTLLEEMCRVAVEVGGYRLAWVGYALDNKEKSIHTKACAGVSEPYDSGTSLSWNDTGAGATPAGRAIRTGRTVITRKLKRDPAVGCWHPFFDRLNIQSSLSLPLVVNGQVIGVFTVYSEDEEAFDDREQAVLEEMSQDLAFGIRSVRIRAQKEAAEHSLRHMAYHDPLTDLPNYRQCETWLAAALSSGAQSEGCCALLSVGLVKLQEINASLGYEIGDRLLQETGLRISQQLLPGERLARLQGNEFGLLLPEARVSKASLRAQQIVAAIDGERVELDDFALILHVRSGLAVYPEHGKTPTDLIQRASTALQLAIADKSICALYSPQADKRKKYLLGLAGKLHEALENDQLELHYQPKICLATGQVLGFEALARWHHPQDGAISPEEFIKVAEETGMIHRLSRWVLKTAIRQCFHWQQHGFHLPVAVNLSPGELHNDDQVEFIRELAAHWQLEPGLLEIEITEHAIMEDPESARQQLAKLRAMGISLYIDDFGTGFSSLASLKMLPFDAIKIDKSFVMEMLKDTDARVIVSSTIRLAHELNLRVVAEGVETEEVWLQLQNLGCNVAQGYFIAKPMPAEAIDAWLRDSAWAAAVFSASHRVRDTPKSDAAH